MKRTALYIIDSLKETERVKFNTLSKSDHYNFLIAPGKSTFIS
jgi:hypothetical protein